MGQQRGLSISFLSFLFAFLFFFVLFVLSSGVARRRPARSLALWRLGPALFASFWAHRRSLWVGAGTCQLILPFGRLLPRLPRLHAVALCSFGLTRWLRHWFPLFPVG